jgi:CubicO group peptidase (beta-lactamase class C family)
MKLATLKKLLLVSTLNFLLVISSQAADLPNSRPSSVGMSADRIKAMDAGLQAEIDAGKKAGITVLLARKGRLVHLKSFGYADLETGQAMAADSFVRLYSMTKPITSVALLTLMEQGKFKLSDPLDMYIPEMANLQVFAGLDNQGNMLLQAPNRKPTIHDIFRHTGGFSYGNGGTPVDEAYQAAGIGYGSSNSLKQMVTEQLPNMPLLYQPGERWVYSVSHDIQAYLVEYFSGMPFDEYLQQTIFDPLGMEDIFFGVPPEYINRYTANYAPANGGGLVKIENQDGTRGIGDSDAYIRYTNIPFGGSGLSATISDYAKFAVMLTNGGELDGVRILSPKTVEFMSLNHLPENIGTRGDGSGYGLGVSVLVDVAASGMMGSVGEFGWAGAATTWVNMDPEEDLVSILFTQYMPTDFDIYARWQNMVYQSLID